MIVEYEYRVTCPDGTMWDEFPVDANEARKIINRWADNCGCASTSPHLIVRRVISPVWELVGPHEPA